jgi:hypothetical protein
MGDNIKMDVKEIECEGVGCIHLLQDRDQWWDLVNTTVNFRLHKRLVVYSLAERLSASQGICSMELVH